MSLGIRKYAYLSIAASIATIVLKFGAYYLTDSVGLLSDAAESLVNLAAGIMALIALTVAHMPPDSDHAYGHGKAEFFSSGVEGILILVASVGIAVAAISRFLDPRPIENLGPGLVVAIVAAAVNFFTARAMFKAGKEYDSITLEADAKHLMTDVYTSVGVVAGLGVMLIAPASLHFLDPLIAVTMAVNIAFAGVGLIRRSAAGLMDSSLPESEIETIKAAISAILKDRKASYHDLRTRKAGANRFVEFHLLVPGETMVKDSHDLCCAIEDRICKELPNANVLIHAEPLEDKQSWTGQDHLGGRCPER
ncbi:MAG: cation diffusion facilitator family transporter [Desulfovibrio sp.]|uniref:cation diffusion facilitator family transporter n=1 Tax=Desulfovibrio sp. 7SRBS1 TaxID=3378064 RepID=UPI003B3D0974